jgi:hypothetical protein
MLADGLIELTVDSVAVAKWQLASWRRSPGDREVEAALAYARLNITESGARWRT